jgi:competence protein ComEC
MSRRTAALLFVLLALLVVIFAILIFRPMEQKGNGVLTVAFLDVGQGDSIFIESPSGTQVLIDGGANASVLRGLGQAMGFFDRTIDLVVATHQDQDHIGGLIDVLERYSIATILLTENESETPVAGAFMEAVTREGSQVYYARSGQVYDLGAGLNGSTTLTILFPDRNPRGLESNTSSIVSQLRYGDIEFMLTGDSPIAIETYLVALYGDSLESEVLKVGHHGSRTSTSEAFLEKVSPEYAIISAEKDNRYGHPHKEVIGVLNAFGAHIKNTADDGSIFFTSNGVKLETR